METVKLLQSTSITEIEEVIANQLSDLTEHEPSVQIRAFELLKENGFDTLTQHKYRIEMFVTVPKFDKRELFENFPAK